MVFQQKLTILTVLPSIYTEYLLALSGALVFIMVYYIPSKATFTHACTNFFKILQGSSDFRPNMCYIF